MALLPDGPIDTLGVLDAVLATPDRVAEAAMREPTAAVPDDVDAVLVLVDGGEDSAVDAVLALVGHRASVPVVVDDGRALPAWVGDRTLVIGVAAGEATTLGPGLRAAAESGVRVVGVGAGPVVEGLAERDLPVLRVGEGLPAPRYAVPSLVVGLLTVLAPVAPLPDRDAAIDAAVAQLRRRVAELTAEASPARTLARRIGRTLTLAYGAGPVGAAAAHRWKRQVNDDVKAASFAAALPGLAHHELAGWGQHGDVTRQVFSLVTCRHDGEHVDDAARFPAVEALVDEVVHARHELTAEGDGPLAQLLDLFLQIDVTAYHLAQEHEIDPGPSAIDASRSDLQRR